MSIAAIQPCACHAGLQRRFKFRQCRADQRFRTHVKVLLQPGIDCCVLIELMLIAEDKQQPVRLPFDLHVLLFKNFAIQRR